MARAKKEQSTIVSHPARIYDPTYSEMSQLSEYTGIAIPRLIGFMWLEFKRTKKYASLMLLGDTNKDEE